MIVEFNYKNSKGFSSIYLNPKTIRGDFLTPFTSGVFSGLVQLQDILEWYNEQNYNLQGIYIKEVENGNS